VAVSEDHVIVGAKRHSSDFNRGSAYVFDLDTGDLVYTFLDPVGLHTQNSFGVSVAVSENHAVVGSLGAGDEHVYVFDLETGDQLHTLTEVTSDGFGRSVAIDGDHVVIGAGWEGVTNVGAAYVYDLLTGRRLHRLQATGMSTQDEFGSSVAAGGGYAVVGATRDDSNGDTYYDDGSASVFDLTTGEELLHLIAVDGAYRSALGRSVAIDDRGILVGTDRDSNRGAVYHVPMSEVSSLIAIGRSELKVTSDDAGTRNFGGAVAISGNRAVVGASHDDVNGAWSGSAYIVDVQTGSQLIKLVPSDGANEAYFGESVAVDGDTVLIGTRRGDGQVAGAGCAYIYDLSTGNQIGKLVADDGAIYDGFGRSVAIRGDYIIIGAPSDDDNGSGSGSAYLFDASTGLQLRKLIAPNGGCSDRYGNFGNSVAAGGGYVIVGAHHDDEEYPAEDSGSAYVFDVETGDHLYRFTGDNAEKEAYFGCSVAVSGKHALVGASGENDNRGSAYVFDLTTGDLLWKLATRDSYGFGLSVALSGDYAIIGTKDRDEYRSRLGGAYIFDITTGEQMITLMADDADSWDLFGAYVATDGQHVLVGAPGSDAAYIYNIVPEPATIGILTFSGLLIVHGRRRR